MMARLPGTMMAAPMPCMARNAMSIGGVRRNRAGKRRGNEQRDAGDEGMPQAETVAGGAASKDERRKRQRIGVGNPLRLGEAGAEIDADRRRGDGQDRAVDEAERGGQDRRDQHEAAPRLRAKRIGRQRR